MNGAKRGWLPASASSDARLLLATRALRGFADGVVSVLLASYLSHLGFSALAVGAIVTGTLLGSAVLTITVGLMAQQIGTRRLLRFASMLMFATGLGFAGLSTFWPLLVVAVVGTLNPSAGDVSVFLPTEQAALAQAVDDDGRTMLYAWYNLAGALTGAAGALASGLPEALEHWARVPLLEAERAGFLVYALFALFAGIVYRKLSPAIEPASQEKIARPLAQSRAIVLRLAALFSLDSFGGGFVVQALLVLWLFRRFHLSTEAAGSIFFVTGLLGALSQLVSARIARRIGLIRTMAYTHLPSNLFLVLAGLMPTLELAVLFLVLRAGLSQMDVPARQSFVMSVVSPKERAAAASVTNVPRSLAAAIPPLFTGLMLEHTTMGWPLICAGVLKGAYDVWLLRLFQRSDAPTS